MFCKKNTFVLEIKSKSTGDIIENLAMSNKLKYTNISLSSKGKPIGPQFGIVYLPLIKLKSFLINNRRY